MSGIRLDSYFLLWSNTVFLCDRVSQSQPEVQSGLHPSEAAGALTGWLMLEGKRQGGNRQPGGSYGAIRKRKCQGREERSGAETMT